MNKDVYPQDVDFEYRIRCDAHQFKPYVYCEMCKIRTKLQEVISDARRELDHGMAQTYISLKDFRIVLAEHKKQIEELQIEVKLLKGRSNDSTKD